MGLLKDLFALNRQAKEMNRNYDPGAQTRRGLEMMRQLNPTLASSTQAQKLAETGQAAAGTPAIVRTRLVRAAHGDSSGVRGAAWLWDAVPQSGPGAGAR